MKKISLVITFVLVAVTVNAQFDFGVSGGLNFSSVSKESIVTDDFEVETLEDSHTGYHIGLMSQISFLGVFVQPELLFTSIGNDMMFTDKETGEEEFFTRKINRLDIPVVAGTKIGPLRVGLGPVGSIIINETSELKEMIPQNTDDAETDIIEEINNLAFGLQAGVGINLSNLIIDVKYEYSLSKLGDGVTVGGEERSFDSRPRQFIISLGVIL